MTKEKQPLTARLALELGGEKLRSAGVESARLDMSLILAEALRTDRLGLLMNPDRVLTEPERLRARELLARRLKREPIAYILGRRDFYGLTLEVTPEVLIPRPETEHLVDRALAWLADEETRRPGPMIADIGTGSGAIAVAVAQGCPRVRVIATDISPAALAVARRNAERHAVAERIEFREGSLLAPLREMLDGIVSNPPYVALRERADLAPEVGEWEPAGALFGGEDGLDAVRELVGQAPRWLKPDGILLVEIGAAQGEEARKIAESVPGLEFVRLHRDYAGHERLLEAKGIS